MYIRLQNFIDRHKLFNKLNFGFRNDHSTFMALVIRIENVVNALSNGKNIFVDKLYCYGKWGIAH